MSTPTSPAISHPLVFLRLPEVERRVGLKRATIYRMIATGEFIPPVKLRNSSAWPEHEVNAWLAKKLAARDARGAP